jgi:acyl-coenzyme A thioesterase PaaI-like protein
MHPLFSLPRPLLRFGLNWWPPLWGAGIRVRRISPDFREVDVEMPLRWSNRNGNGAHFGGSLYAMTDPFYALMLMANLGTDYVVWDRSASIDHVAPGRSRVRAQFRLGEADLQTVRQMTESGSKHLHVFQIDVVDEEQLVVARVEKVVYVRRRRPAPSVGGNRGNCGIEGNAAIAGEFAPADSDAHVEGGSG